jgi:hypothetical protein
MLAILTHASIDVCYLQQSAGHVHETGAITETLQRHKKPSTRVKRSRDEEKIT